MFNLGVKGWVFIHFEGFASVYIMAESKLSSDFKSGSRFSLFTGLFLRGREFVDSATQ